MDHISTLVPKEVRSRHFNKSTRAIAHAHLYVAGCKRALAKLDACMNTKFRVSSKC